MPKQTHILLIGAGELGSAFWPHLAALPNTRITVGVRNPSKHTRLLASNVDVKELDITAPSSQLSIIFSRYDIVISATGFGQTEGSVMKLVQEILQAGKLRKDAKLGRLWYFPWQWGVDYDVTGDGDGLMPLFGEQKAVRGLLRKDAWNSNVEWTIVSTGIS